MVPLPSDPCHTFQEISLTTNGWVVCPLPLNRSVCIVFMKSVTPLTPFSGPSLVLEPCELNDVFPDDGPCVPYPTPHTTRTPRVIPHAKQNSGHPSSTLKFVPVVTDQPRNISGQVITHLTCHTGRPCSPLQPPHSQVTSPQSQDRVPLPSPHLLSAVRVLYKPSIS